MLVTTFHHDCTPWERHQRAVAGILNTMANSWHQRSSYRRWRAPYNAPSDIPGLDQIVQIDKDSSTAWVEPNVTMEALVRSTMECGLMPAVVAVSKEVSVADAFAATTTESSSFMFGSFDCTVISLEAILNNGHYVIARTHDGDTSDLLYGSAGAMHSLALTTLLEIVLVPASSMVAVTYWPGPSVAEAMHKMQQIEPDSCRPEEPVVDSATDFVESIVFDSVSAVVITGRLIDKLDHASVFQMPRSTSWVEHAASIWRVSRHKLTPHVDVVPLMDYLFRHDTCHMYEPSQNKRREWRMRRLRDRSNATVQGCAGVLQNVSLPFTAAQRHIHSFHAALGIWPICVFPVKHPSAFGRRSLGIAAAPGRTFWNIRFFAPDATCDGVMERDLKNMGGFRYLQCRAPCNQEVVWVFHDHRWYSALRSRWNAQGFPDVGARLLRPLS
jgi:FAD/FMN-containing dehydrogenase